MVKATDMRNLREQQRREMNSLEVDLRAARKEAIEQFFVHHHAGEFTKARRSARLANTFERALAEPFSTETETMNIYLQSAPYASPERLAKHAAFYASLSTDIKPA